MAGGSDRIVLAHGGAEADPAFEDGTRLAAEAGMEILRRGGAPLDAAVAACVSLEEDPRFNAGRGSDIRLDGVTIQMDAACADSLGRFGGVALIENVLHPVLVARAIADTPHLLLAGRGAEAYARRLGMPVENPWTSIAQEHFEKLADKIRCEDYERKDCEWACDALKAHWNYSVPFEELYGIPPNGPRGQTGVSDTVGAVATDGNVFAAAASTGGTMSCLLGRIGDTPLPGSGLDASEHGAVACTGQGEHIVRRRLAARVLRRLEEGEHPEEVLRDCLGLVPEHAPLGLVILDKHGRHAAGGKSPMPWSVLREPTRAVARPRG